MLLLLNFLFFLHLPTCVALHVWGSLSTTLQNNSKSKDLSVTRAWLDMLRTLRSSLFSPLPLLPSPPHCAQQDALHPQPLWSTPALPHPRLSPCMLSILNYFTFMCFCPHPGTVFISSLLEREKTIDVRERGSDQVASVTSPT